MDNRKHYQHAAGFRHHRSDRGAVEPQCRQAEVAVDETVVQDYIDRGLRQRAVYEVFTLVGPYQQGIAHLVNVEKRQPPDADPQELHGLLPQLLRMEGKRQYMRRQKISEHDAQEGETKADKEALGKKFSDLSDPALPGPSGDQRLEPAVETRADGGEEKIVDTGDASCRKGLGPFIEVTEEDV